MKVAEATVYDGATAIGVVALRLVRDANNIVGYSFQYESALGSGSQNFAFAATLDIAFLHNDGPSQTPLTAANVSVASSGFDGNLATTDDTVQKVAQKVDDLASGGLTLTTVYDKTIGTTGFTTDGSRIRVQLTATEKNALLNALETHKPLFVFFDNGGGNRTSGVLWEPSEVARGSSSATDPSCVFTNLIDNIPIGFRIVLNSNRIHMRNLQAGATLAPRTFGATARIIIARAS